MRESPSSACQRNGSAAVGSVRTPAGSRGRSGSARYPYGGRVHDCICPVCDSCSWPRRVRSAMSVRSYSATAPRLEVDPEAGRAQVRRGHAYPGQKCLKGAGFLILLKNGVRTARVSRGSIYMLGDMVRFAGDTAYVTSRAGGPLGARAGARPRPTAASPPGEGSLRPVAQELNTTPAPPPTGGHLYYHTFSVHQLPSCGLRFDLTRLRQEVRRLTSTPKRRRPRRFDVDEAA